MNHQKNIQSVIRLTLISSIVSCMGLLTMGCARPQLLNPSPTIAATIPTLPPSPESIPESTQTSTPQKLTLQGVPLPYMPNTKLFGILSKGCERVDLATWQHPTREVMIQRGVEIIAVQLCNDRTYPVFYVNFPYAPHGQTKDYFDPLYAEMKSANGGWPFAFVSMKDQTIVQISPSQDGAIQMEFDQF
ncbi:hypothetical protein ACN4EG_06945 [Alkalinema pantanalense CENA528]|uniref:hypothetical protein n=1 Tax=Alkalinema pantanalense TaxID=1620705 RepID=UPI003D6F94AF